MRHDGGCHCGAIAITYESDVAPEETEVRACQCSFCRKHASRAVSDPTGKVTLTLRDESAVQRYRFGLATADYYLCGRCGVYVAAVMPDDGDWYAVAIINAFEDSARFTRTQILSDYSAEDEAGRRQRRRERWTPAEFVSGTP
jgi:hypothetical protein